MSDAYIEAAARLTAELLEPSAVEVEQEGVPRSHLDALAKAGLLGLRAPAEVGGSSSPRSVFRAVGEILAGACPTTWFVQEQHHTPMLLLAASAAPLRAELLPKLATGEVVAGIAFAHLRRFPERPVVAERVAGGWRFQGSAPWYTGWGINDVMLLGGIDDQAHIVWVIIEAAPRPGLRASPPMQTAAVAGAMTVGLDFDGLVVGDRHVVARMPHEVWQARDDVSASDAKPAMFGVTAAALRELARAGERDAEAASLAALLRSRLDQVRAHCYRLADDDPDGHRLDERRAGRAEASVLLTTATTALVVASGGRAMTPDDPAGRLARTALFLLVQAQTLPARAAALHRWHTLAGNAAGGVLSCTAAHGGWRRLPGG
ncbi:MAG: acyl-CoA dehydrogenase family protein [Egibacteraceae bacterium]